MTYQYTFIPLFSSLSNQLTPILYVHINTHSYLYSATPIINKPLYCMNISKHIHTFIQQPLYSINPYTVCTYKYTFIPLLSDCPNQRTPTLYGCIRSIQSTVASPFLNSSEQQNPCIDTFPMPKLSVCVMPHFIVSFMTGQPQNKERISLDAAFAVEAMH